MFGPYDFVQISLACSTNIFFQEYVGKLKTSNVSIYNGSKEEF